MSEVSLWSDDDLVAAVTDLVDDWERCPRCNLTEEEGWLVEAELVRCPTCEDRDRQAAKIDRKHWFGWGVRFDPIQDPLEQDLFSSRARFTLEGARRRPGLLKRWRERQSA